MSSKKTKKPARKGSSRSRRTVRSESVPMCSEDVSVLLSAKHPGNTRNQRRKTSTAKTNDDPDDWVSTLRIIDADDDIDEQDIMGTFKRKKVAMSSDLITPVEDDEQSIMEDNELKKPDPSQQHDKIIDVVLPIIIENKRDTKSAFEIEQHRINLIMQASGSKALQKLYTSRHGVMSRKPPASTAGAETRHAIEEQYQQFEDGVRSIRDDSVDPSENDMTRAELFGSLLEMPAQDAENLSVRTLDSIPDVEIRHRATEEEYLRAPFYDGERECRNGQRCQGNFVVRVGGFTLVEYNSLELVAHRKEHVNQIRTGPSKSCDKCHAQLCVICSRMLQQKRWATNAARNCAYDEESVPSILPDYHNLIGPGEYDAHQVYSCSKNKIQFPELPVVIFCNTSFRRSERQMDDGAIVPEYKQVLTKPEVPAFRDGRV